MVWLKRVGIALLILIVLAITGAGIFAYKAKNGFARYETTPHDIDLPGNMPSVLLFSKTTAFRHSTAIKASIPAFERLANENGWFLYHTEDAGIINQDQLKEFDVIIWNNSTGPVLTKDQRLLVQGYINDGGGFIGIHGAGDDSHKWPWYIQHVIGARFSHHPIKDQIQEANIQLHPSVDSSWNQLSAQWNHSDEWYIFYDHPSIKGMNIMYSIDGTTINPNGNLLWVTDKDFGMGEDHPVAWYNQVGAGRIFYTSMGHTAGTFDNPDFLQMLKSAVQWTGGLE